MTIHIRLTAHAAIVTELPHPLARLLGAEERVYHAVPDARGTWWAIRDERADRCVSARVQRAIEQALEERRRVH